MNILEIIAKKRDKKELSKREIEYFIKEYTEGIVTDYQAAALVMAIYINGMTKQEITDLTLAMAYSGDVADLSELGIVVDKHSTGGVGDKVTLILMPIIASLGVNVAKMSGRGLGFTGGTADKLEAIPGYNVNISEEEFISNVKKIGISLMTQTLNLAPADKKIYGLRDTISCTDSIPLIASSIMSKKIASGANKIVLDVTYGSGAFMKTKEDAQKLASIMQDIGELADKETVCVLTSMEQPLGYAVGNSMEIIEATKALKGDMPEDVKEVVLELGSYILKLAGKGKSLKQNKEKMIDAINSGRAYQKWIELIKNQGGDVSYIEDLTKFEKAKYELDVVAEKEGTILKLDAGEIGRLACNLGAGRIRKEDKIDMAAGIMMHKKVGETVSKGDKIATLYTNKKEALKNIPNFIEIK